MLALHAVGDGQGGLMNWWRFSQRAVLVSGLFLGVVAIDYANSWTSPEQESSAASVPKRVRVSQGVSTGLLIKKVDPDYSKDLKKRRVQGMVSLGVLISKEGDVIDVKPFSGDPELIKISVDAIKQWKYKPYLLNNEPVEVETRIQINYTLAGG